MRNFMASALCALIGLGASAQIDPGLIQTYNTATKSNDPALIVSAAIALGENVIANPEDENATTIAFEVAQQICMREDCEKAQDLATFLSTRSAEGLPESGVEILTAFSNWRASPNDATTAALTETLENTISATPSMLSLFVFQAALGDAAASGDTDRTLNLARLTKTHVEPVRELVPKIYFDSAIIHAVTTFNEEKSTAVLSDLAELEIFLHTLKTADKLPETMDKDRYLLDAWQMAISAVAMSEAQSSHLSKSKRDAHQRNDEDAKRKLSAYYDALPPAANEELPACKGKPLRAPKPTYPRNAARKGYVGAVLTGFKVEDGKIKDVRVLASVPDALFEKAVLKSMENMGWEWEENPDLTKCSISPSVDVVMPFQFGLR